MRYALIVLLAAIPITVQARDLALQDALRLAEAHSFALKRAEAVRETARSGLRAARSDRLPVLSATAQGSYVSFVPEVEFGPLPAQELGTHDNYQADLRLSLPLYTGGRIAGGVGAAGATVDLYDALAAADHDRLAYMTRAEYLTLLRTDRMLGIAHASLTRAQTVSRDAHSLYDAGAADSVALLEAELALTRVTFAISQAENARRASELRLLTYLGLDPAETLTLTDSLSQPSEQSWESAVDSAKPEIAAANATLGIRRWRWRASKSDFLPALSAMGGYSYGKPNLDRFNNTWNDYFTVGATLTWSFNLGGKSVYNRQAAFHDLEAARLDREQTIENLSRDARLAVEQLKLSAARYTSAEAETRIARDNFRLASVQHRNGTLTSNRLITIEADLTTAEGSLAAALIDYHIALSAYYYAVGSDLLQKGDEL
jgi:outer membrane protein TolC